MFSFLEPIIQWIIKKFVVFLVILLILVLGLFVKSNWDTVASLGEEIANVEKRISEQESQAAGFLKKLRELNPENDSLSHPHSLEEVAIATEELYQRLDEETPWWHVAWVSSKARKRDAARELSIKARQAADGLETAKDELASFANSNRPWLQRLIFWIRESLHPALAILAGLIMVPWILKAVLYFGVAPMADRLSAIRIRPIVPTEVPHFDLSAVSREIEIQPGQELLIRPEFLQSSTKPSKKRTRWFLNARLPISSAISKMIMLTAIRPEGEKSTRVVVSATKDPLAEVGIITLQETAMMVIHPRALAGVIKPLNGPVQISSEWRLGNLHSWLTLQLRYLVIQGPCALILKGCRGVKAEPPDRETARILNQSATIGFSAHLDYSNTRCETFMSYFTGKEDLFNDQFAGENGLFVYEEMPDLHRNSGKTGRGLEGVLDSVLKVFGI